MGNKNLRMRSNPSPSTPETRCFGVIFSNRHRKAHEPDKVIELSPMVTTKHSMQKPSPIEHPERTSETEKLPPIELPSYDLIPTTTNLMYHRDIIAQQIYEEEDNHCLTEISEEDMRLINNMISTVVYDNLFRY